MKNYLFLILFFLSIISCVNKQQKSIENISKREQDAVNKQTADLGELIASIPFEVKTDNKDFENGTAPWARIDSIDQQLPRLIDGDKKIIEQEEVTLLIDYPLTNEYRNTFFSKNGFTRKQLLKIVSEAYHKIYEEEEASAKIKTIPIEKKKQLINRNQTDGKYGIWGHDIADLVLSEISIYKNSKGKIFLVLGIES